MKSKQRKVYKKGSHKQTKSINEKAVTEKKNSQS